MNKDSEQVKEGIFGDIAKDARCNTTTAILNNAIKNRDNP